MANPMLNSGPMLARGLAQASALVGAVNARWFGVSPNKSATENDVALIAMRDALIADGRDKPRILNFEQGLYQYTNNRWLCGLTNVEIIGYGAQFENNYALTYNVWDAMPLSYHVNNPWINVGDAEGSGSIAYTTGQRIDEATEGDTTITLQTLGDVATYGYAVGGTVLVHSFNQQGDGVSLGFPPNPRYFEYRTITGISGAVLTLDRPLAYDHLDDYADWTFDTGGPYIGKPRVINLTGRPQAQAGHLYFPDRVVMRGVEFLENPNHVGQTNALAVMGRHVELIDVKIEGELWPTQAEHFRAENVTSTLEIELDKCVETLELINAKPGMDATSKRSILGGTGCNHVRIINPMPSAGIITPTAQQSLILEGGHASTTGTGLSDTAANAPIELYGGTYGGRRARIDGVRTVKTANQSDFLMGSGTDLWASYAVGAVSGDAILVPKAGSVGTYTEVFPDILKTLRPGITIYRADGGIIGRVSSVVEHDASNHKVNIAVEGTMPIVGETIYAYHFDSVSLDGEIFAGRSLHEVPIITGPSGSISGGTGTFSFDWNGLYPIPSGWWLYIGSTDGGSQLYSSGSYQSSATTTAALSGLPTNDSVAYVTLYYRTYKTGTTNDQILKSRFVCAA